MSIASMISQFGILLQIRIPVYAVETDGSGQSDQVFQGRINGRRNVTIYFEGALDISVDAEIHDSLFLPARQWRVTGTTNPGELGQSGASQHLNMTVVDAVEINPEYDEEL
jgi:hypothetical protein